MRATGWQSLGRGAQGVPQQSLLKQRAEAEKLAFPGCKNLPLLTALYRWELACAQSYRGVEVGSCLDQVFCQAMHRRARSGPAPLGEGKNCKSGTLAVAQLG